MRFRFLPIIDDVAILRVHVSAVLLSHKILVFGCGMPAHKPRSSMASRTALYDIIITTYSRQLIETNLERLPFPFSVRSRSY